MTHKALVGCMDYAFNLFRDDCRQIKLPKGTLKTYSTLLHCGAFRVLFVFLFILAVLWDFFLFFSVKTN